MGIIFSMPVVRGVWADARGCRVSGHFCDSDITGCLCCVRMVASAVYDYALLFTSALPSFIPEMVLCKNHSYLDCRSGWCCVAGELSPECVPRIFFLLRR
jgi:hypothetical protein